jgi:hypothetical protein
MKLRPIRTSLSEELYWVITGRLALDEALEEAPGLAVREVAPEIGLDSVRLYFSENGKSKLLTASQEVEIGKEIETAESELRRALAAVPRKLRGSLGGRDLRTLIGAG